MHVPVWKRTNSSQIIGLALVLGLAASITLNVVMLTRSQDNQTTTIATQGNVDLLARQQRYYAAKEARQETLEAEAGALFAYNTALTQSQQRYVDLKSAQMNGVASAHMRFIEENILLPEAAADVMSAAEVRLWDQNILPGDDLPEVAPYTTTGAANY